MSLHSLVYLCVCLCVWIPTPAGSWGLDSGLAAGIFACWALLPALFSLYRRRPHDSARVLLTPGDKVASAPQGRFHTCAVACCQFGDCAQLLWVMFLFWVNAWRCQSTDHETPWLKADQLWTCAQLLTRKLKAVHPSFSAPVDWKRLGRFLIQCQPRGIRVGVGEKLSYIRLVGVETDWLQHLENRTSRTRSLSSCIIQWSQDFILHPRLHQWVIICRKVFCMVLFVTTKAVSKWELIAWLREFCHAHNNILDNWHTVHFAFSPRYRTDLKIRP